MIKQSIVIQNKLGLHVRAAAKLVDTAKKFSSQIQLILRDRSVDAKSIMNVITLGAQKDQTIEIQAEGEDETQAVHALSKLINAKFGED